MPIFSFKKKKKEEKEKKKKKRLWISLYICIFNLSLDYALKV